MSLDLLLPADAEEPSLLLLSQEVLRACASRANAAGGGSADASSTTSMDSADASLAASVDGRDAVPTLL